MVKLSGQKPTSREMLDSAYEQLNYDEGSLIRSSTQPLDVPNYDWIEKGDWIALAFEIGADSIFFVNNDPVIVFFETENDHAENLRTIFLKAWSMARPQCLFIALPGEIKVYSLNKAPVRDNEWENVTPLAVARNIVRVAEELKEYNREQIETGQAFAEKRFGNLDDRADKRLIQDLRNVRQALIDSGLSIRYTHSLIGRSIFIRYLEDRRILNREYFENIAIQQDSWHKVLFEELEKPDFAPHKSSRFYHQVLKNKSFTYALFRQLAEDFNGDLFSTDVTEEEKFVSEKQLELLRLFLLGDSNTSQQALFFWAYDFSIVPIELISSIYEEFYHLGTKDDKGTYYTPSVLVEYVLSNLLTEKTLKRNPRILDPACGSGVFLVEAFRRIVRFKSRLKGEFLSPSELREILRTQISGIEIDSEAIHVTAFSLYLALMHYQEPPAIQENPRLPKLIFDDHMHGDSDYHYGILFNNNTFDLTTEEYDEIKDRLEVEQRFKGRVSFEKLLEKADMLPIPSNSVDIIVGNPPWGFVHSKASGEIQQAQKQVKFWCDVFDWSIGDNELSQAFIARSLRLLTSGGQAGLLVSAGIFFKHHANSIHFRKRWLTETQINKVVNFAHVRHLYFSAVSPFAFVQFQNNNPPSAHRMHYLTAKRTRAVNNTQSVILSNTDMHRINQVSLLNDESLWKVYWWGGHNDAAFISALKLEKNLGQIIAERQWPQPRQGYTPGNIYDSPEWLRNLPELPIRLFKRYGKVVDSDLVIGPTRVHRRHSNPEIFSGWRLLVKRGITEANNTNGRIEARLEQRTYVFRNSIHAINLELASEEERKIITAILWSSLARYYFFMTSSTWGFWHHELHLEEVMSLPIRFPSYVELKERIITIVDQLLERDFFNDVWSSDTSIELRKLEQELDNTIFDLFELSNAERDLVLDMCKYGLDFLYQYDNGIAVSPLPFYIVKNKKDILMMQDNELGLARYISTFLNIWNTELEPDGEFRWDVVRRPDIPMIAIIFTTQQKNTNDTASNSSVIDKQEWQAVLKKLDILLQREVSREIYIDGIVRAVSDTNIFIIKRDEQRLWTRSKAREDAQATLLQAMQLQESVRG